MRVAIRDVIELVCPKPAALLCKPARDMIVVFRILVRFFRNCFYFRAERAKQMHFLRRLIIWNHNYRAISPRPSNYGKDDPGVTSGSLHDRGAWLKPTGFLSLGDDAKGSAILHRSARIHEFSFPQNLASREFRQPP